MKNKIILLFLGIFFCFGSLVVAKHFWRGTLMSLSQAEQRWGNEPFDLKKFHDGDPTTRAKMAVSLIKSKKFIGKPREDIRKELGDWDGYYFSGMFPAYIIEEGKSKGEDTWQIVFLLTNHGAIDEVVIHKNCCDR